MGESVFPANLRYYMEQQGKSGRDVAVGCGVSPSTVSYWLSGTKHPSIEKIAVIAEYFGIRKSDLLEDRSQKKRVDPQTIEARIISGGIDRMSPENREKALNMMRLVFAEYFERTDDNDA